MPNPNQSKPEVIITYAAGASVLAVVVWVIVAFMRAENMLDGNGGAFWKGGAIVAAFWMAELLRRRIKKH